MIGAEEEAREATVNAVAQWMVPSQDGVECGRIGEAGEVATGRHIRREKHVVQRATVCERDEIGVATAVECVTQQAGRSHRRSPQVQLSHPVPQIQ